MKKSNSKSKAQSAFKKLGAVALITATIFFVACKQTGNTGGGGGKPTPKPKHAITFSVEGGNGTLKAEGDGITQPATSPINVEQGKEVTFTATANDGYRVKGWTLDGKPIAEAGTKMEYKHTVTKPATITVNFELIPKAILTLAPDKLNIKVKAKTADDSDITVEGCNETKLTSDVETELHANGAIITLKGYIIELECIGSYDNRLLTALNVQGLTSLQKLNCSYNKLTALNVQGLTALQELNFHSNQLTELDVQGLTALQKLDCSNNKLTALNVQGLTALQELNFYSNQLTELDVSNLTTLQKLSCGNNKLPELNVQGLTALQELECYENKLTSLNVQGLTSLQKLSCSWNQLTALDVQSLTSLQKLNCSYNKLTALNVQGLTNLQKLECYRNQLPELNVQGLTNLQELSCGDNKFTELNVQGLTSLQKLSCHENQLTSLDVQGLTNLQELYCGDNKLTELNVQGLTSLQKLYCGGNKLKAQAMTEILNALPARKASDKGEAILYTEETDVTEGNCKDFTQPAELKAAFEGAKKRNWKLQKRRANWQDVDI